MLDEAQQQLLLRLTPSAFDGDRGNWGLELAQTYALRGDRLKARVYSDSARLVFEDRLEAPRGRRAPRAARARAGLSGAEGGGYPGGRAWRGALSDQPRRL